MTQVEARSPVSDTSWQGLPVTFQDWVKGRQIASLGTNAGAPRLPFQGWHNFKEAFAPELVHRAVRESHIAVRRCLDPFGGSGTTALASQFLGITPATIEVNPFLADLIEAKLAKYDVSALTDSLAYVLRAYRTSRATLDSLIERGPATLVEPGVRDRWVFDRAVANRIGRLLDAVGSVPDRTHARLFRVILGGSLVGLSNVVVSGKGRRYRRNWFDRRIDPSLVERRFSAAVNQAIAEINQFAGRASSDFEVYRGDCRTVLSDGIECDLAVFSPPYPNSFDYTDVYNLELWMLGYMSAESANTNLRVSTLCSHVQITRTFPPAPVGSPMLDRTLQRLVKQRELLWNNRLPHMVAGYFADMMKVLGGIRTRLTQSGSVWIVVGDSRYAGVRIRTGQILAELAETAGWTIRVIEPCRSMRTSAQQGGRRELAETLLVIDS